MFGSLLVIPSASLPGTSFGHVQAAAGAVGSRVQIKDLVCWGYPRSYAAVAHWPDVTCQLLFVLAVSLSAPDALVSQLLADESDGGAGNTGSGRGRRLRRADGSRLNKPSGPTHLSTSDLFIAGVSAPQNHSLPLPR